MYQSLGEVCLGYFLSVHSFYKLSPDRIKISWGAWYFSDHLYQTHSFDTSIINEPRTRPLFRLLFAWFLDRLMMRVLLIFQALVYDILPSTTAIFSYTIGSRKLSANKQFFVGAQTVVSLLQTTQIKQGLSFIATNKVYTSTNKTTIIWTETELFLLPGVDASHVYVRALALVCF